MGRRGLSNEGNNRATLASSIYERLRDEIVAGGLAPGEKLRIDALKQRYGLGTSPIREALNRLSTERLVVQLDQRGFIVAPVSLEELQELTETRCALYELLLPRSLERGDAAWEEGVVLALHRLRRAEWMIGDPPRLNPAAREAHRDFHRSLIAACGLPPLVSFMDTLFDFSDRYRLLSQRVSEAPERDIDTEHSSMADAAINRHVEEAIELAQTHVRHTAELVQRYFSQPAV